MANKKIIGVRVEDHSAEVLADLSEKMSVALASIGAEAVRYADAEVPVDTSRLKNSLSWATSEDSNSNGSPHKPKDGKPNKKPEKNTVYIGTNVEYAVYVEYGDQNHKVGKKHFLRDAMANHGNHYKAILEAALKS